MPYIENTKESIRTSLARARGRGASGTGTHHWLIQRVTSVALIPLTLWMLTCIECLITPEHAETVAWMTSPFVAIVLVLFTICAFYHAALGMQVVIEDYVHKPGWKFTLLILSNFTLFALGAATLFALLVMVVRAYSMNTGAF